MAQVGIGKTNAMILAGEADLSVWSDEELTRGQRRDRNGGWSGRPPKVVPTALHRELTRRQMQKVQEHLRDNLLVAAEALTEMIQSPHVDDSTKVRAIQMIFDRVLGKAPEKIDVQVFQSKMQEAFEVMLVPTEDDVIDAEIVEADDTVGGD